MIGSLRGTLARKAPEAIVVDVGGVGYLVHVPLSTFYSLGDPGAEVELRIHTHVGRDGPIQLFGFLQRREQLLFERLLGVARIGPKLAISILSGMEIDDLLAAIVAEDVGRLATIPGVGRKAAERIALELQDKLEEIVVPLAGAAGPARVREDVLSALVNLGYKRRAAERALERIEEPEEEFDALLRQTLRALAR